jgi:hypothetical protein
MSRKRIKKTCCRSSKDQSFWRGEEVLLNLLESGILNCDDETKEVILSPKKDLKEI